MAALTTPFSMVREITPFSMVSSLYSTLPMVMRASPLASCSGEKSIGSSLAMVAGAETLRRLAKKGTYEKLGASAEKLARGFQAAADEHSIPFTAQSVGAMWGFFFCSGPVRNFADAQKADQRAFKRFFASMLDQGIYLAPSPYEAAFVSLAHTGAQVEASLEAARKAMSKVARAR